MQKSTLNNTIKELLITDFKVKEALYREDALLRELNSGFVLLANVIRLEKSISNAINHTIHLRGYISILDATVQDIIQIIHSQIGNVTSKQC